MFNGLTVLSLVLCVAMAVIMVRSFFVEDEFWLRGANLYRARSAHAGLLLDVETNFNAYLVKGFEHKEYRYAWSGYPDVFWYLGVNRRSYAGFECGSTFEAAGWFEPEKREYAVVVPELFLLVAGCLLPAFAFTRALRTRRRRMRGLCKSCGYNLTGNVSGVCPECGTLVEGGVRKAEGGQ
jgi:hypothetical protein